MSNLNAALAHARSPLERLETALAQASSSGKNQLEVDFKQAYPLFEQHIARKMRKKLLAEQFNAAYKHQVTLIQFRKLLSTERERRKAEGDELTCTACGQTLCPSSDQSAVSTAKEEA